MEIQWAGATGSWFLRWMYQNLRILKAYWHEFILLGISQICSCMFLWYCFPLFHLFYQTLRMNEITWLTGSWEQRFPRQLLLGGTHPPVPQSLIAQHRHGTVLWEGPSHDDVWDLSVPLGKISAKVAAGPSHSNLKSWHVTTSDHL